MGFGFGCFGLSGWLRGGLQLGVAAWFGFGMVLVCLILVLDFRT